MSTLDRRLGAALALLAGAVFWTAMDFPAVPGQRLGAGFLPMIVAGGLAACGLGLMLRRPATGAPASATPAGGEHFGGALVVVAVVAAYIALADRLGFLIVAPLGLLALFRTLGVGLRTALLWSVLGSLAVHLVFYKLLRVPLPWGVLRPWY